MRETGKSFGGGFRNWLSARFKKTRAADGGRLNCNRLDRDANIDARIGWIFPAKQTFPIGSRSPAEPAISQIQSVPQSGNDFHLGQLPLKQGLFPLFHAHWLLLSRKQAESEIGRTVLLAESIFRPREIADVCDRPGARYVTA